MRAINWQRLRHWSSLVLLTVSVVNAIGAAVLGNASFFWHVNYLENGDVRKEVWLEDGMFTRAQFYGCQFPADGKIWYGIEWQNPSRLFARKPIRRAADHWNDEPVGWTVERRYGFLGFEYATGEFWPPFAWQHPRMPFQRVKIPLLAVFFAGCIYPAIRLWRRHKTGKPT